MVRVQIAGVALDALFQTVVILRETEGGRSLPIWIGPTEAQAIALRLEGKTTERPWSHDLLSNILDSLTVSVPQVVINDLQDNTFYALIYLQTKRGIREVDSRPSDALALAIRTGSPIFVTGRAMDAMLEDQSEEDTENVEKFKKLLEDVDFGGAGLPES